MEKAASAALLAPPSSFPLIAKQHSGGSATSASSILEININRGSGSVNEIPSRIISGKNEIEKYLREEKELFDQAKREPKLLLLGSSDSGKSTVLKQLKLLHGAGFSEKERLIFRKRIRQNLSLATSKMLEIVSREMPKEDMMRKAIKILSDFQANGSANGLEDLSPPIIEIIRSTWTTNAILEAFENGASSGHALPETTRYFTTEPNFSRITNESYLPTDEDILNVRTVTQNINDTIFNLGKRKLHVIDVSGISSHRKHWISYFTDVKAVLFIVSLSCFDMTLAEDSTVNRMVDSLVLFEETCNNELLKSQDFILFLNKKDLFEKKVKSRNIIDYFPNYKGRPGSVSQGVHYFEQKLKDQNKRERVIITHTTCCTDIKAMKVIMTMIIASIIEDQMSSIGVTV